MSLFSRLLGAVRSLRRRRVGPKTSARAGVSVEQLDHRQLLSVNFTGNVATDFPATTVPGVVVIKDNPDVTHPTIAPDLQPAIKVAGVDISGIRVSYTAGDDTLSIGLEQPLSQQTTHPGPVIAGDVDNNGNDGTVGQEVLDLRPSFQDYPNFGGSEYMGAFLDLKGTDHADIVAGYALNDPRALKEYQVALANVNQDQPQTTLPVFGQELPQYAGNVYKVNSVNHPNFEFAIKDFSKLYLAQTGKTLTADSEIGIGAFAGAQEANGVGKAFFPESTFTLGQATVPPEECPPVSPPVWINPHSGNHINTAHQDDIRVSIFGSSGFDVTKIVPSSVTLGGATPVFGFDRHINADGWLDATFVFNGSSVVLPPGWQFATVSGELTDGTKFSSQVRVFNRDRSFYTDPQNQQQQQREVGRDTRKNGFTVIPQSQVGVVTPASATTAAAAPTVSVDYTPAVTTTPAAATTNGITVDYTPAVTTTPAAPTDSGGLSVDYTPASGPVSTGTVSASSAAVSTPAAGTAAPTVSVPLAGVPAAGQPVTTGQVTPRMQSAINRMSRDQGSVDLGVAPTAGNAAVSQSSAVSRRTQAAVNRMVREQGSVNLGTSAAVPQAPVVSHRMQASINRMVRDQGFADVTPTASAV